MKHNHRLDPLFGPSGSFAGFFILLVGILTFFLRIGLEGSIILILIGSFVGFTHTGTCLDMGKKRVRLYTAISGILRVGTWYSLDLFQSIAVEKSIQRFRVYSRSNRQMDTRKVDYRIVLLGKNPALKIPIQKFRTEEEARSELEQINTLLKLKNEG